MRFIFQREKKKKGNKNKTKTITNKIGFIKRKDAGKETLNTKAN